VLKISPVGPVLDRMVTVTINNGITISWTVLTNGGSPILRYIVEWIEPGSSTYRRAPNGRVEDSSITSLHISFSNVFASVLYRYRIVAITRSGTSSAHVFTSVLSPKGKYACGSCKQIKCPQT